jgi:hypothetical protein
MGDHFSDGATGDLVVTISWNDPAASQAEALW